MKPAESPDSHWLYKYIYMTKEQMLQDIKKRLISTAGHNTQLGNGLQIYGTIDIPGFKIPNAQRNTKNRFERFGIDHLTNKTVLDLGSNIGCISFEAYNRGAKSCLGIEYMKPRVDLANDIAKLANINDRVKFIYGDLNTIIIKESYDIVFALAVDGWLTNKNNLYGQLGRITKEALYFETHIGASQGQTGKPDHKAVYDILYHQGFSRVDYINKPHKDTYDRQQFRPNYVAYK